MLLVYVLGTSLSQLKSTLRRLKGSFVTSREPSIWVCARYQDSGFELTGFSNDGYAGCRDSFKSTSDGTQFLGKKLVGWSSKKKDCTALSPTEAEYVSLSTCCSQVIWMRTQLTDYGFHFNKIPIYCDFKSAIAISYNPVQHSRTKHIAVRYHFIKEHIKKGTIELYFVKTGYQLADIFTKALPMDRFNYLVCRLGMRSLSPYELEHLIKSCVFGYLTGKHKRDSSISVDLSTYICVHVTVINGSQGTLAMEGYDLSQLLDFSIYNLYWFFHKVEFVIKSKLKFVCYWADLIKDLKRSNELFSLSKSDDTFPSLQALSDLYYLFGSFMDYLWSHLGARHHSKQQNHRFLLVMLKLELHTASVLVVRRLSLGLLPRYTSCFSRRCPILNSFDLGEINVNSLTVNHVIFVFLFVTGVDENIINKHYHKSIQVWFAHTIHEVYEHSRNMEGTVDITEFFRKLKFVCYWADPIKDLKRSSVLFSLSKSDDTFPSLQALSDLYYLFGSFMDYLWSCELDISNFGPAYRLEACLLVFGWFFHFVHESGDDMPYSCLIEYLKHSALTAIIWM
uniref:Retrovirus-related Pol polyprotein from transposon TNT 1-94 n=1 Tax=Tanacetum cinerariifolium TaxID=118510 RepID=A0A699GG26_TANCI|nr:retrovirus-related Pol polyprotein from transposon TNT 1-94 [Tanacetum cinerariifolium]